MLTANIKFKNFKILKNQKKKNILNKIKKINWLKEYPVLKSLTKEYEYSFNKKILKSFKKQSNFRLIGMGGSVLGAESIYQFLKYKVKKNFIFVNNLNQKSKNNKKKIKANNIIISKSGNTLETILNSNLLLNKNKNIFITEKNNSYLFNLAKELKSEIIEHKNYIGGRYSVLSEVGMLPAEIMGLDVKKFKRFNYLIKNNNFLNHLIKNVDAILKFVKLGKFNSIILNYDENSDNLFKWYQQLVAESLGKKSQGILPTISTMPKDNHSLLQLYLEGPKKSFYSFFYTYEKKPDKLNNQLIRQSHKYLKNKSISKILHSQKLATENIFFKKKIPFRSFEIINRNEETMGDLFCFFILETILLGRALNVNPFDQPSVELIKKETKRILFI